MATRLERIKEQVDLAPYDCANITIEDARYLFSLLKEAGEALEPLKMLRDELRNQYIETYDTRHIDTMKYSAIVNHGMLEAAARVIEKIEGEPTDE